MAGPQEMLLGDADCAGCGYNLRGLRTGGNCPECGRPIRPPPPKERPREKKVPAIPRSHRHEDVILEDRLCDRCRYNLRGLPATGKCPECGHPIRRRGRKNRFTDNLTDAPLFYLKTLALGLMCTALACALFITANFVNAYGNAAGNLRAAQVGLALLGGASILWWVGVFIATAQRPLGETTVRDAFLESRGLRIVNRATQAAWALGALILFFYLRTKLPAAEYAARATLLVASFGLIPLALHMSALADWAGDTGLSERFKVAAWAMAAFGVVEQIGSVIRSAGLNGPVTGLMGIGSIFASLLDAVAQGVFLIGMFQLGAIAIWAIRNAATASASARRIADRKNDPTAHRQCSNCGYSLAGLPPLAPCPECGVLEESIRQSGLVSLASVRRAAEAAADLPSIPLEPAPRPRPRPKQS